MKRIVCIGNRDVDRDAAGPVVHDRLKRSTLPPDVEVCEGGLVGLDLLRFVEGAERVVFVDAVWEASGGGGIAVYTAEAVAATAEAAYGHAAGLAYALRMMPLVCEGPLPEILVVGMEGEADKRAVAAAAEICVTLAVEGWDADMLRCAARVEGAA